MIDEGIAGFTLTRAAPAKINLALHVVGQRADGHHLLESLVTFADRGDRIGFASADADLFTVSGPFAAELPMDASAQGGNLVLKARDVLRGRRVQSPSEGKVMGIAASGALLVESASDVKEHRAGTIRFAEDS